MCGKVICVNVRLQTQTWFGVSLPTTLHIKIQFWVCQQEYAVYNSSSVREYSWTNFRNVPEFARPSSTIFVLLSSFRAEMIQTATDWSLLTLKQSVALLSTNVRLKICVYLFGVDLFSAYYCLCHTKIKDLSAAFLIFCQLWFFSSVMQLSCFIFHKNKKCNFSIEVPLNLNSQPLPVCPGPTNKWHKKTFFLNKPHTSTALFLLQIKTKSVLITWIYCIFHMSQIIHFQYCLVFVFTA